jgi:amidase
VLDDYYHENKRPWGPLHGLPVSLKDQFHIDGVDTFMGYAGWIGTQGGHRDKEKTRESDIVKVLHALGAVLYCKVQSPTNGKLKISAH